MPVLTPARFARHLEQEQPAGAYFLHGEEEHLREAAVQRVVAAVLDPTTRDFNFDQLRGDDVTPETLASILATPPMMAEHRVVVVRDVQGLSPKAREVVESVAASPPAGLVLVLSGQKPSGSRAKFYDQLQKLTISVEFPRLGLNDLPGWLTEHAREEHGLELEIDAARALVSAIGSHLGVLSTELEKLASFASGRKTITLDDVRAVGGYIPRVDRWAWFDLVGERRFEEALRLLPELLEAGESAVGLVAGMGGHLLRVGIAVAGGPAALEKELPPNQRWLARRVGAAARAWTVEELDAALADLLRTDRLLKSAPLTDRQAIEELLLRLAGAHSGAVAA
ncbi:MAG TPA: DNA polymerase III subunit delta [Longimicrobiaceae bacterium]